MPRPWLVLPLAAACGALAAVCAAAPPRVKWTYTAASNLYGPAVVADVHPSAGQEVIVCDAEARLVRCLSARGRLLWTYRAGWMRRAVCVPSLSRRALPGRALLVAGNADGMLHCFDARTGKAVWRARVGAIEWGAAIWADVNGDGRDEVIAGTRDDGIVALDARGRRLWAWRGEPKWPPVHIGGPVAAADIDADGCAEVFAATGQGPVCLNGRGRLRWSRLTSDAYTGAVVVADADHDSAPEAYCTSSDENAIWRLDARTGAVAWKVPLPGGADVYDASSIAIGDVDGCGDEEVVVSDRQGLVQCIGVSGEARWEFRTETRTAATVTLGDVDGDGSVEALVTSDDRSLYALDSRGDLKWRFAADRRLVYPATIADVDLDGRAEILLCACDRRLRCLTLGGRWDPLLVPWPSRRFDAAQTGSAFGRRDPVSLRRIEEAEPLMPPVCGTFDVPMPTAPPEAYALGAAAAADRARRPRYWRAPASDQDAWRIDTAGPRTGAACVRLDGCGRAVEITGPRAEVGPGLTAVTAAVYCRGDGGRAAVRWMGANGLVRDDALAAAGAPERGWRRLAGALPAPRWARSAALVLATDGAAGSHAWFDDAALTGSYTRRVRLDVLVNQVGYGTGMPKRFTVQTNLPVQRGWFEVRSEGGAAIWRGELAPCGRIVGAYGSDWGSWYLRGDFTALDRVGRCRIAVEIDGVRAQSAPFRIGPNVLWRATAQLAVRMVSSQRCGTAVPGIHGPCHLDGARNLKGDRWYDITGGWHDAGDYNPSETQVIVYGLARAYAANPAGFDAIAREAPGSTPLRAEIPWGADQVRRMVQPDGSVPGPLTIGGAYMGAPEIETDNLPRTGDERPVLADGGQNPAVHAAGLAKCARWVQPGDRGLLAAAERAVRWCEAHRIVGPEVLDAAIDLWVVTRKPAYASLARRLFATDGLDDPRIAGAYDAAFGTDHRAAMRDALVRRADRILQVSGDNPFGVFRYDRPEGPMYLWPPPPGGTEAECGGGNPGGTNTDLLPAAITVMQAYRCRPDPRYLAFVVDQLNWLLGTNPFGVCMLEGAGSRNPPSYHACITFAGLPRGAIPGGIVNGIVWRGIADDRPAFDLRGLDVADWRSNEIWLPHNMRYLQLLAELARIRR